MKDRFQKRHLSNFIGLLVDFLEWLVEEFPDCTGCSDTKIYVAGSVQGSETQEPDVAQGWYEVMQECLSKKVKYGKAIARITGEEAVCYHAVSYRDSESFLNSSTSTVLKKLALGEKYKLFSEEKKQTYWKFIDEMNAECYACLLKKVPTVPSREEIQKNIKSKHTDSSAFLHNFESHLHKIDPSFSATEADAQKFGATMGEEVDGVSVEELVSNKDPKGWSHFQSKFPFLGQEEESKWKPLQQACQCAKTFTAVPSKMRSKIDSMASKLAEDLSSGKMDFASLDMEALGKEVMESCDPNDMDKFASNLSSLMPMLGSLPQP